jgi:hypothetical protein
MRDRARSVEQRKLRAEMSERFQIPERHFGITKYCRKSDIVMFRFTELIVVSPV